MVYDEWHCGSLICPQNTISRECNPDAVAARNTLEIALASKIAVVMEDAPSIEGRGGVRHRSRGGGEDEGGEDPYALMTNFSLNGSGAAAKLGRIVEVRQGSRQGDTDD